MDAKIYTAKEMWDIIAHNNFDAIICEQEKDGKPCKDTDTIQIALKEQEDYLGEFVGNFQKGYIFNLYKI